MLTYSKNWASILEWRILLPLPTIHRWWRAETLWYDSGFIILSLRGRSSEILRRVAPAFDSCKRYKGKDSIEILTSLYPVEASTIGFSLSTYDQCASRKLLQDYTSYTYHQILCAPGMTKHKRGKRTDHGPEPSHFSLHKKVWVLQSMRAQTIVRFNTFSRTDFQLKAEKISSGHLKPYAFLLMPSTEP